MMSRISRCACQPATIASRLRALMPLTSASRSGSSSITASVSSPNRSTMRSASFGPMPLMTPEPR